MEAVNNPNPVVYSLDGDDQDDHQTLMNLYQLPDDDLDESIEPFDALEVFDLLRNLRDPEHPQLTLEQLKVIEKRLILVENDLNNIQVLYTPTVPHCSMATLIGLCIRVKLLRSLPSRFKVQVKISPGSHASELDGKKLFSFRW